MSDTKKFDSVYLVPPDEEGYEDMVAEISYGDDFVILIDQEKGIDALDISIYPREDGQPWKFPLSELEVALHNARARLRELGKIPDVE